MKYARRDRSKVIALSLILLVFWLFIIFEFTTLSKRTRAKLAEHESTHAAAQSAQPSQAAGARAMSPTLRLAALVAPVAPPRSDPFRPVIPPRNLQHRGVSQASRPPSEPGAAEAVLPPMPDSGGRGALTLTGIIAGSPSAAVLRMGDAHYVVREGDLLEGGLRVQQITRNTVVLREGRSTYTLRLGG